MALPFDYFDPPPTIGLPMDLPAWCVTADFDGDGLADLAFGTPTEGWVALGPELAPVPLPAPPTAAADLDGDGYDDLIVGYGPEFTVIGGAPDGLTGDAYAVDGGSWLLTPVGDLDEDGYDDLAFGATVWFGSAGGPVEGATICEGSPIVSDGVVDAGDVDGDGHRDLVVICGNAHQVVPGNGDRTFGDPRVIGPLGGLQASGWLARLADADGDGVDELFYASRGDHDQFDVGEIVLLELTDPVTVAASLPIDGRRGTSAGVLRDAATGRDQFLYSVDTVLRAYALTDGALQATVVTAVSDRRADLWWASGADFDGDGAQEVVASWFTTDYYDWGLLGIWGYDHGLELPGDTGSLDSDTGAAPADEPSTPKGSGSESGGCGCDHRGSSVGAWLLAWVVARSSRRRG